MKKLILISLKRTLNGRRKNVKCDFCNEPLRHNGPGADLYWCPICGRWQFTDLAMLVRGTRRNTPLIEKVLIEGSQSMESMNKKMDAFLKKRKEELDSEAKIYTSNNHTQSFLEHLIPSLWRIK